MTLLVEKGFRQEDFANLHPGGKLGKKLMRVEQLMHRGEEAPIVEGTTRMHDVMYEMSRKALGMTCVVDNAGRIAGIITDGDLRRQMISTGPDFLNQVAADVMTRNPTTVTVETLAAEALNILEQRKITSLVVVDDRQHVQGVVHLHDLWRTEMI
jgi:arabinose-5-phosphate isomerase